MRFVTRIDPNNVLVAMTDQELQTAVTKIQDIVTAASDLRCFLAGVTTPNAKPADAGTPPPRKPRRPARKVTSAKSAKHPRVQKKTDTARPAGGAPCRICGGEVDRTGRGGYKRTLCATCKEQGVSRVQDLPRKPATAPASQAATTPPPASDRKARLAAIREANERLREIEDAARAQGALP